ncbi:MAG: outer membrane protein assembly factor BamD [Nitrospinota bacterium]|nr:outer membrane protein assembly factor BamD [Nitrospinota bacterium]
MIFNLKITGITIFLIVSIMSLNGCFSKPKEGAPPGRLLTIGQEDLVSERYENAKNAFELLLKKYPNSKHRREALFNLAEVYYRDEEFLEAQVQFSEFVQLYPLSRLTDKAYFLLAMSYFNVTNYHDQDQENTQNALKNFRELLKRFPKSKYKEKTTQKIKEIQEFLSEHEFSIAYFYFKKGINVSCIPRFNKIILNYPDSLKVKENSLFYLGNAYFKEQSYKKAWKTFMQLLEDYPRTKYRKKAINFLESIKTMSSDFKNKKLNWREKGLGFFKFFKNETTTKKKIKKNKLIKQNKEKGFDFFKFFKNETTTKKKIKKNKLIKQNKEKGFDFFEIFK